MKHLKPVTVARADFFEDFLDDMYRAILNVSPELFIRAFTDFFSEKKNLLRPFS